MNETMNNGNDGNIWDDMDGGVTDDFDPETDPNVAADPFHGAVKGVVHMGTLRNVLGAVLADPVFEELKRAELDNARGLSKVFGHPYRYY